MMDDTHNHNQSRPGEPLAQYIRPDLDEGRLARQRAEIAARIRIESNKRNEPTSTSRRFQFRSPLVLVPALCVVVAAIVFLLVRSHVVVGGPSSGQTQAQAPEAMAGTVVEAPSAEPLPITLLDGSHIILEPQTRLSLMTLLAKDIRLQLDRGGVEADVTHVEDRQFVITAAGYEARVLGTRFSVKLLSTEAGGRALEVRVVRGRVRVTRIGDASDVRVLGAGETWSTALTTLPPPSETKAATGADPTEATPSSETTPPVASAASAPPSSSAALPRSSGDPTTTPAAVVGSKELWAQAESARASKRFRDEAVALNTLRLRHRSDPRAGLAAFELGRLRQDTLSDPAGAAEAFADAVTLAPNGPFREDAEARRIEALEAMGDRDRPRCLEAKAAFLARYPGGIHRQRVSSRCEAR